MSKETKQTRPSQVATPTDLSRYGWENIYQGVYRRQEGNIAIVLSIGRTTAASDENGAYGSISYTKRADWDKTDPLVYIPVNINLLKKIYDVRTNKLICPPSIETYTGHINKITNTIHLSSYFDVTYRRYKKNTDGTPQYNQYNRPTYSNYRSAYDTTVGANITETPHAEFIPVVEEIIQHMINNGITIFDNTKDYPAKTSSIATEQEAYAKFVEGTKPF